MKLVHSIETSGNFYCTMLSHCTRHYFDLHALIYLVQYTNSTTACLLDNNSLYTCTHTTNVH